MSRFAAFGALAVFSASVAGGGALAQSIFAVPRSDRVIEMELVLQPQAKPLGEREYDEQAIKTVRVLSREGTLVTIEDQSVSPSRMVGLQFAFAGENVDDFVSMILKIDGDKATQIQNARVSFEPRSGKARVGPEDVGSSQSLSMDTVLPLNHRLKLTGVDLLDSIEGLSSTVGHFPRQPLEGAEPLRPSERKKLYGRVGGGECCVACGAITVCASAVSMRCGSCEIGFR